MAELARINPAAAIECPSCQMRLTELPLDDLAEGADYDCPYCGQQLRIPDKVLKRLLDQRDAGYVGEPEQQSWLSSFFGHIADIWRIFWS